MKKQKYIIITAVAAGFMMGGCNIYRPYSRPEMNTQGLYRDTLSMADTLKSDTVNMGDLPWKEIFKDTKLQSLIEAGLANNIDLQTALLRVEESRAQLMSSRLAYLPSLNFAPSGTVSSFDKAKATQTYQLPVVASWELDLSGKLLNAKRGAKAAFMQSESYRQYVQTQVIAGIANTYYTLLMLDRQLEISQTTVEKWKESVETMRALKLAGSLNEAAVVQGEANYYAVSTTIPDLLAQIRSTENALCLLLGEAPHKVGRGTIGGQVMPEMLSVGIPAQLLSNRPDVKAAEMALAVTSANTNVARAGFYPQLTLSANGGWVNSAGTAIFNPAKIIASATASLVQPLFNRGANLARLRVAKAQQEEARLAFQNSILAAGNEVNDALFQYKASTDKSGFREKQVYALELSVDYTTQLLKLSNATYLEVLTAQQSLLSAQLSQVSDNLQRMQSVVSLYQALGGGR